MQYSIAFPQAGAIYVGFPREEVPTGPLSGMHRTLPEVFSIVANSSISNGEVPDIYLNGYAVKEHFYIELANGDIRYEANSKKLRFYLKQGINTMTVEPVLFGPTVNFTLDSAGPEILIEEVTCDDGDCTTIDSGNIQVSGLLSDPTDVTFLSINGIPVPVSSNQFTANITEAIQYEFIAVDAQGYQSKTTFLADGQALDEIIKVRVGETALEAMEPILEQGMYDVQMTESDSDILQAMPPLIWLDLRWATLKGTLPPYTTPIQCHPNAVVNSVATGKLFGDVGLIDIQELNLMKSDFHQILLTDGQPNTLDLNLDFIPLSADTLDDVVINSNIDDGYGVLLKSKMFTAPCGCSNGYFEDFYHGPEAGIFEGLWKGNVARYTYHACENLPVPAGGLPIEMTIETLNVDGKVDFSIVDGEVSTYLRPDFDMNLGDTGNINGEQDLFTFLINWVKGSVQFKGLIRTIVQNVLNAEFNEINIAYAIADHGAKADLNSIPDNITSDDTDLYMNFTGKVSTTIPDKNIPAALGSYYVEEPLPEPVDDPTTERDNLAVTVNSNMINQLMLALYNTGFLHFTILNKEVHFGSETTDTMGKFGDTRIKMVPSSPPVFKMRGSEASITYRNATMVIETKLGTHNWPQPENSHLVFNVDMVIGTKMNVVDGKLNMELNGAPSFVVNYVAFNRTGLPIVESLLNNAIELVLYFAVPYITESLFQIDIPTIEGADITTESIGAVGDNSQHLGFSMGANKVEE